MTKREELKKRLRSMYRWRTEAYLLAGYAPDLTPPFKHVAARAVNRMHALAPKRILDRIS